MKKPRPNLACMRCGKDYGPEPEDGYPPNCGSCMGGKIAPVVPPMTDEEWKNRISRGSLIVGVTTAVVALFIPTLLLFFVPMGWAVFVIAVDGWRNGFDRPGVFGLAMFALLPMLAVDPLRDWATGKNACSSRCRPLDAEAVLVDGQCLCEKKTVTTERFAPPAEAP